MGRARGELCLTSCPLLFSHKLLTLLTDVGTTADGSGEADKVEDMDAGDSLEVYLGCCSCC